MTAADVIRMLAEMDQQCISGRPSAVGRAAEIVQELCRHAEGSLRNPALLGDYESIDLSAVRSKRVSGELWRPTLGLAEENDKLRDDLDHAKTLVEILNVAPRTLVRRPGGCWDVFEDAVDAGTFERDARVRGEHPESFNVSHWNVHIRRDSGGEPR